MAHYLELAQIYVNEDRYAEAEKLLAKAYELSNGDADIREKWEDSQLRALRHTIAQAKDAETKKKLQDEYFEKDMEFYKARVGAVSQQSALQVRARLPLYEDPAVRRSDPRIADGEERSTPAGDVHARPWRVLPTDQAVPTGQPAL